MKKETKRLIAAILAIIIGLTCGIVLTACGNKSFGFGEYNFKKVHIFTHDGHDVCLELIRWHDDSQGIEIYTKDYDSLFISEGAYMLCQDKCPICDK